MPDFFLPDPDMAGFLRSLPLSDRGERQAMTHNFSGYCGFAQSIRKDI